MNNVHSFPRQDSRRAAEMDWHDTVQVQRRLPVSRRPRRMSAAERWCVAAVLAGSALLMLSGALAIARWVLAMAFP